MAEDTKERILAATLETLRRDGLAGASARAIAETGGLNSALIFYHFGTLEGALVAAMRADTAERVDRARERMAQVATLPDLAAVARELHEENVRDGSVAGLVQMLAATVAHPGMREPLGDAFEPWIALIEQTLDRVAGPDGLAGLAGNRDMAVALTALFLGLELLTHLGDRFGQAERLLEGLDQAAVLVQALGVLGRPA